MTTIQYASHFVVWRGECDTHTEDVAESVARLATAATTTQLSTHSSLKSIRGKKGVTYLPLTCIQL